MQLISGTSRRRRLQVDECPFINQLNIGRAIVIAWNESLREQIQKAVVVYNQATQDVLQVNATENATQMLTQPIE